MSPSPEVLIEMNSTTVPEELHTFDTWRRAEMFSRDPSLNKYLVSIEFGESAKRQMCLAEIELRRSRSIGIGELKIPFDATSNDPIMWKIALKNQEVFQSFEPREIYKMMGVVRYGTEFQSDYYKWVSSNVMHCSGSYCWLYSQRLPTWEQLANRTRKIQADLKALKPAVKAWGTALELGNATNWKIEPVDFNIWMEKMGIQVSRT